MLSVEDPVIASTSTSCSVHISAFLLAFLCSFFQIILQVNIHPHLQAADGETDRSLTSKMQMKNAPGVGTYLVSIRVSCMQ